MTTPTPTPTPTLTPALSLQGLRFRWPGAAQDVIDLATLDLQPGDTVFLRGPSGCGKSTLLSLAAGVLLADAGTVALLGQSWAGLSARASLQMLAIAQAMPVLCA